MPQQDANNGERTRFVDKETGRTIWRVTSSRRHDKHTYYDLCPWSPDSRYILFSSADPADLAVPPGANVNVTQKGQLCLLDTGTYTRRVIADNTIFESHQGTFSAWSPKRNRVYFQKSSTELGVFDVDSGTLLRTMGGFVWWMSPETERFAFASGEVGRPENGIYTMNEDGSDRRMLAATRELFELSPFRDAYPPEQAGVGLAKWSPDGEYVLFNMWVIEPGTHASPPGLPPCLFVVRKDGSQRWCVGPTGHHQSFTPDSKRIIWGGWMHLSPRSRSGAPGGGSENRDPRIFMVNIDGSDLHVVVDEPVAGHPTMDPTCTWIVTSDERGVVLVDVARRTTERLAVFHPPFDTSHRGTHPHCVWSRDGTLILYNSAESGVSQLYVLPMDR